MPRNNDNTRLETLIVLDYLLKFTDEKHLSSRKKIEEYALVKYDYKFSKPQRITICLEQLEMFSNDYNNILRFEIKTVSSGVRTKYYAKSFLPMQRIEDLIRAIYDTRKISSSNKSVILDEIKNTFLSEYEKGKWNIRPMYNSIATKFSSFLHKCEEIYKNQNEFKFVLRNWEDSTSYDSHLYYTYNIKNNSYVGKIKKIIERLGNYYLVILILDRPDLISIPIENLIIKEIYPVEEQFYDESNVKMFLDKYLDLDELIGDFFDKRIKNEINISFSFKNSFYILSRIKRSYELFFNEGFIEDEENENTIVASISTTPKMFFDWIKIFSLEKDIKIIDENIKNKIVMMYEESIRNIKKQHR